MVCKPSKNIFKGHALFEKKLYLVLLSGKLEYHQKCVSPGHISNHIPKLLIGILFEGSKIK